ncbi:hypothetical protein TrST_g1463 [Triparma strigata]|uniref:Aminotransferase class V domain-containing protein n=1 Tax=Triparma strigata TaxID=1606541 RepID=A0A9W6ZKI4_9STRA|nr:hypothetical protein TrST_g1463 [Triparma strigata]
MSSPPPTTSTILANYYAYESSLPLTPPSSSPTYLNTGAFGVPYPSSFLLNTHLIQLGYEQPMVYHRSLVPELLKRSKKSACEYLKISNPESLNFVCSVSSAIFRVLENFKWMDTSVVITSDCVYHSIKDCLSYLVTSKKIRWIQITTNYNTNTDEIYEKFEKEIRRNDKVDMVLFDHVSSKPSILFPAKRICSLCKTMKIPTLVDGAHVPGSLPSSLIDIDDVGACFYVLTFHKWCHTIRSAGGLVVNKDLLRDINKIDLFYLTRIIPNSSSTATPANSVYYLESSQPGYLTDYITRGIYDESTRSYENFILLTPCLLRVVATEDAFQKEVKVFREEVFRIWKEGFNMNDLEVKVFGGVTTDFDVALPMVSLLLPTERLLTAFPGEDVNSIKKLLTPKLWEEYGIEVPVFVWKEERLAVRISYGGPNVVQGVEMLVAAVNKMC